MMSMQGSLSVERMCRVAAVSRASFYRWLEPSPSVEEDVELRAVIQAVVLEHRRRYGYRRVTQELRRRGWLVNHKRVARLMSQDNLLAMQPRAWMSTTNSSHELEVYMNLAARMKLSGINQLWVADITYIRLAGEFVYLAVVLDAYSRKVVGWELGRNLKASLAVSALRKAIAQRQPSPGLVHHSDRGLQYCSLEYVQLLEQHGIMPSMSRPANPYDNAFCESFMRTLKREEIQANVYRDLEDLRPHLEQFVEQYYNRSRLHSALGYRPPQEFEQLAGAQKRDLAGPPSAARVSFLRHGEIYRWGRETAKTASPAHPIDESPTGYSLAGCSPAVPDSASPAEAMVINDQALGITKNSKQQMRAIKTVST
jgi:putative transposase